jgi:phenylpyruvate tautomerase PptA (4-oxalocrotonate tautomerase family)
MTRYISQPGLGGGTIGDTSPYILFEGLTTAMIRVVGRDSEDRKIVFDEPAGSAYCVADMPEAHKKACAREREIAQILWNFHVPIRCDSRS